MSEFLLNIRGFLSAGLAIASFLSVLVLYSEWKALENATDHETKKTRKRFASLLQFIGGFFGERLYLIIAPVLVARGEDAISGAGFLWEIILLFAVTMQLLVYISIISFVRNFRDDQEFSTDDINNHTD